MNMRYQVIPPTLLSLLFATSASAQFEVLEVLADRTSPSLRDAAVGDVDGDRVPDLIVTGQGGYIRIISGATGDESLRFTVPNALSIWPSVAVCGDIDRDGYADLAVSNWTDSTLANNAGAVRVHSSRDGSVLFERLGALAFGQLGSVASMGDINGDGTPDFGVIRGQTSGVMTGIDVHSGATQAVVFSVDVGPSNELVLPRSPLGDLDGDGFDDVLCASVRRVRVYSGRDQSILMEVTDPAGPSGWILSIAGAGDCDQDGTPDIVLGGTSPNMAVLISGSNGGELYRWQGFGRDVDGGSDVDGDGTPDVLVGSEGAANPQGASTGATSVFSGATGELVTRTYGAGQLNAHGSAVRMLPDLDGDGRGEFAVCDRTDPEALPSSGSVRVYSLNPPFEALSFQADAAGKALANGAPVHEKRQMPGGARITGSGTFGAAIFDSDPAGPNASSTDPDLLVDRGNILILQENGGMTGGLFDEPDDTMLGGVFHFEFTPPARLGSIDMIDLCPSPMLQDAEITMTDLYGNTRQYFVPGGFTDDITMGSGPGVQRLSLTTLEDQPGVSATATASESSSFFESRVRSMDVQLLGSGAIDDIRYLPTPLREPEVLYEVNASSTSWGLGRALACAGDVDGDGVDDLVVGAPVGVSSVAAGHAYVVSGATGQPLLTMIGVQNDDGFGRSVAGIGDVNGDGIPDVLVGAAEYAVGQEEVGAARVISGANGATLRTHVGQEQSDAFGDAIASVGDIDMDGIEDYVIAARREENFGALWAYSGATGAPLWRRLARDTPGVWNFGNAVSSIDDMDGDGVEDVIVMGTSTPASGFQFHVVSARTGDDILVVTDGAFDVFFQGAAVPVGDMNGDGVTDLVVAARERTPTSSLRNGAIVVDGAKGTLLRRWTARFGTNSPTHAGAAGDMDGDGIPDVVIAGPEVNQLDIVGGADGTTIASFVVAKWFEDSEVGEAILPVSDLNGDGIGELVFGAPRLDVAQNGRGHLFAVTLGGFRTGPVKGTPPPRNVESTKIELNLKR